MQCTFYLLSTSFMFFSTYTSRIYWIYISTVYFTKKHIINICNASITHCVSVCTTYFFPVSWLHFTKKKTTCWFNKSIMNFANRCIAYIFHIYPAYIYSINVTFIAPKHPSCIFPTGVSLIYSTQSPCIFPAALSIAPRYSLCIITLDIIHSFNVSSKCFFIDCMIYSINPLISWTHRASVNNPTYRLFCYTSHSLS